MTKKSSDSEKAKVKIKASTGAWWNSKVEANPKEQQESVEAPSKKRGHQSRGSGEIEQVKTSSTSSSRKQKKTSGAAKDNASPKNVAAEKRAEKSVKPEEPKLSKGARQQDQKKPAGVVGSRKISEENREIPATETVEEKDIQKEKNLKKSTAGRRGRKPKKKIEPTKVDDTITTQVSAEEKVVEAEKSAEEPVKADADKADSEKTRQSNRRGGRGRRRGRRNRKNNESLVKQEEDQTENPEVDGQETAKTETVPFQVDETVEEEKPKVIRLLINAEEPEECRLALLEDGRLESIHVSTVNRTQTKSNIYKATIVAIEPNLQAAFVDYGTPKNGFLPFSEIHPEYFKTELSEEVAALVEEEQWKKLKIEDVMERGQELLVQVVKEEVGKKGANMTTFLSLPGRCVVLMPGSDSTGISRKISGESRRSQLRDIMHAMDIPEGIGWIVRTASVDITEAALSRDVGYLLKLWEDIRRKGQDIDRVGLVYEDHRSVMRFLREHFDPSIQEILVDDQGALEQVNEFIEMLPSQQKDVKVRLHRGSRPIFNQFSIEDQIESIYQPQVNLPSGGSIVINPTEALVAIDVNSGSTSKGKNFEESIYQANMEAAAELARQLRLRDLGGLVVVDFIDMRNKKHVRDVEKQVKISMKRDKAKVDFSRISKFGLLQISRQKLGSPIEAGNYRVCEHCKGRGTVRSVETLALFYLRRIQTGASRNPVIKIECKFPLDVASYLLNNKRHELYELENKYKVEIVIIADSKLKPADNDIVFHKQEKEQEEKK